ncbi:hypothetical protein A3H10_00385 [Candidatus Uhrbacteria bacterium RIFCSPLOWO2_12_FULL_46_10]|uniref:EamA domain-containing protein n=1 Tax=Candidatus Uhrbacteria bacterium RIFCSPLOWO2_01_FULL_47_25 TaxID=1802402 RepID=A0A1F7UWB6_9BACT|nr:MAG: DMT superfamily drug/metabolite permease [Parcubacteria group bacterium GW2011_GWA2_46_9]OGL60071.1 MAG: hypothetical protein A2752_04150 [Candidatus Uhrbacteria bacterium RIFCSPHIGHO2_01_FULL_46_23]OGL76757.1 MAG: hypothetical protein A3E96_00430 [Candidatus Uhrbacteria bacterium RIFCSPHIGHO2_12_FULL_46_13]OGL82569.1 MAG: hypothetical protein A2936_01570 [Candidatus Uhrbacteria bacterium RIFCSPLOWO2_01_FULL_47_25]OGL86161.1 MAG: hypothetical protein A3I37_01590 [Candidatus Uhrbacteria 
MVNQEGGKTHFIGIGPFFVMLAAVLWALDALLRTELTKTIPSVWIVFIEHLVGFVLLSPIFFSSISKLKDLKRNDWLAAIGLTIVSSVLGTVLFTEALARSFANYDFATPILLQKMQPVFVIALAALFLRERLFFRFIVLVPVALVGSYLVSFGVQPIKLEFTGKELVYVLALGAAFAWGAGTILSKTLLRKLGFAEATALRFLLAIPLSLVMALALGQNYSLASLKAGEFFRFVIIAFTTGAGAVLIYYRGLQQTEAKVATIAELVFPAVTLAIAISRFNPYGAPQVLSLANIFGIIILFCAVIAISFDRPLPSVVEKESS